MILLIDNYDSFTFNLYQLLSELGADVFVARNDRIDVEEIERMRETLDAIVISPGPCTPREAGISVPVVQRFAGRLPIMGVCLGHQAVGSAFGGRVIKAPALMHGKTSHIHHNEEGLFVGVQNPFVATRYHSLIVERDTLPDCFEITAETDDGVIMAMRHREYEVYGVQFHPESILTPAGRQVMANFLEKEPVGAGQPALNGVIGY